MHSLRRDFIRQSGLLSGAFFLTEPLKAIDSLSSKFPAWRELQNEINIIHTNDLHNCIETGLVGKMNGLGGLKNIHDHLAHSDVAHLLVDAGDFIDDRSTSVQHREMIRHMNRMGYCAATIGNREISNGQEYLSSLLPLMNFPLVNCNYIFDHPYLKKNVKEYVVIRMSKYKIGITGVGVDPKKTTQTEDIAWKHPYDRANAVAQYLKQYHHCDLVLCLSHLGYQKTSGEPGNLEFAEASQSIDVIVSGHGDAIITGLMALKNKQKQEVLLSHGGPGGILIKQITIGFNDLQIKNKIFCKNIVPGSSPGSSPYNELKRISA